MKKQYDDITTKAYFRRGFNRVILVTFAFIMIPILLMVLVQGGFHDNSALGYISAEDLIARRDMAMLHSMSVEKNARELLGKI